MDSHQNGATSWIPKTLPENVKVVISLTYNEEENLAATRGKGEVAKFVKTFSHGLQEPGSNVAAIGQLGPLLSEKVIRLWLDKCGRTLTNHQVLFFNKHIIKHSFCSNIINLSC